MMVRSLILGGLAASAFVTVMAGASMAGDDRGRSVASDQCVSRPFDTTKVVDDSTLYIDDRRGHAMLLHMASRCLIDNYEAVGLKFSGGTSRICSTMDVDVTGSITTMPTACLISSVESLTPEQAADYRGRR